MNPVTRRTSVAILAGLAACATFPLAATAEDNSNQRRVSIAVPEFSDISPPGDVNAREITEIVVSDLKASGQLALVEPHELVEDKIDAVPHFDRWRSINAQTLAAGRIVRKPDQRIFVEFRLWDVATGRQLIGAQYVLQADDWHRIPHAIAEAILDRLVGRS
jgi:TolB protein